MSIRSMCRVIMEQLKRVARIAIQRDYRQRIADLENLRCMPRHVKCKTKILGLPLTVPDAATFLPMYDEIFGRKIYRFKPQRENPLIIDAGANIGLSTIFMKQQYPRSRVIAIEADPNIAAILQENVRSFGLCDVEIINKALWCTEGMISFDQEGSDSGRISSATASPQSMSVETIRLSSLLRERVDLLKIDIEGAETVVLEEAETCLCNVDKVFVEYHSFAGSPQQLPRLISLLQNAGFRLYIHSAHDVSRNPLEEMKAHLGMDLQLNIYGTRSSD